MVGNWENEMTIYIVGTIIIITTMLIIMFDIYLNYDSIPGNTISERLREWGYEFTWLSFVIAGLMGMLLTHFFGKSYDSEGRYRTFSKRLKIAGVLLALVTFGMLLGFLW